MLDLCFGLTRTSGNEYFFEFLVKPVRRGAARVRIGHYKGPKIFLKNPGIARATLTL